jgi:hypothetical protein
MYNPQANGIDRQSLFKVGAEVFYRNKDKKTEGEGILCSITSILGEGKQRRYVDVLKLQAVCLFV